MAQSHASLCQISSKAMDSHGIGEAFEKIIVLEPRRGVLLLFVSMIPTYLSTILPFVLIITTLEVVCALAYWPATA